MGDRSIERQVTRVDHPQVRNGYTDTHRVRRLVEPGNWEFTDPFLLLMEDSYSRGTFQPHPHRGIETVTYLLDGAIEHYDNHGNTGTLRPGEALWLTTGAGVVHDEEPPEGVIAHLLQLWINLPAAEKLVPAHFQHLGVTDIPTRRVDGVHVRVFSGMSAGLESPTRNHAAVTMVEFQLDANKNVVQHLPPDYNGFVVVLEGAGTVGGGLTGVENGDVAWLAHIEDESMVTIAAGNSGMRVILFAGRPLREPVAARGPFVMNTEEQLSEGFAEYRAKGQQFGIESAT